jgi:hypothetical protein
MLNVFDELEKRNIKGISLLFVGQASQIIEEFYKIRNRNIPDNVKTVEYVSRNVSLEMQRRADFLLLFQWTDPTQTGVLPTKFYEYIAAKIPILVVGKNIDELSAFVEKYALGFQLENERQILDFLTQTPILKRNQALNKIKYPGELDFRSNASRLINLLNDVTPA